MEKEQILRGHHTTYGIDLARGGKPSYIPASLQLYKGYISDGAPGTEYNLKNRKYTKGLSVAWELDVFKVRGTSPINLFANHQYLANTAAVYEINSTPLGKTLYGAVNTAFDLADWLTK
jgi:hypothetical protein